MKTLILIALVFLKGCTLCPASDLRFTNADLRFEALSQIESGVKGASPGMLALLADAYGCKVADLLQDPPQRRDIAV